MSNFFDRSTAAAQVRSIPTSVANAFLQRVLVIMSIGLALTGVTAYLFADYLMNNLDVAVRIFSGPMKWVIMFSPLVIVLLFSATINRMSYPVATLVFGLFAVVMGISLSSIFLVYTAGSIATTFFVTAGMFSAMAIFGMVTKVDLTKYSSYFMMALIGLVIASLVNLFMESSTMGWIISLVGVVLFSALTAYDVQRILAVGAQGDHDSDEMRKFGVMGALSLYMDFINLFLFLLRFLGSSRE